MIRWVPSIQGLVGLVTNLFWTGADTGMNIGDDLNLSLTMPEQNHLTDI